jgi:dihydrofolate reductase
MRKIVVSVYTTLDGVMEAPEQWSGEFWNAEQGIYARELLFASDALLMGREVYEAFAASWPFRTAADDGPGEAGFVDRMNSLPKFVVSTSLQEPLTWNNAHLIRGNITHEVSKLKQQPGQSILLYGGGQLAHTLLQQGLIDELRIWVHPLVRGEGGHLLRDARDAPALRLMDTKVFSSGVVVLSYQPDSTA